MTICKNGDNLSTTLTNVTIICSTVLLVFFLFCFCFNGKGRCFTLNDGLAYSKNNGMFAYNLSLFIKNPWFVLTSENQKKNLTLLYTKSGSI